jgi:hypothetical protein
MKKEQTLGEIRILSERKVPYVELKLDMDDETINRLAEAGWVEIQHDKEALVAYAFTKALQEFVSNAKRAR